MSNRRGTPKYDWADLAQLYTQEGLSSLKIASLKGCAKATVQHALIKLGLPSRHRPILSKEEIIELYSHRKLSSYQIAKLKGYKANSVRALLRRLGIPRRGCSEAVKLSYQNGRTAKTGQAHPRWKGGRLVTKDGYILVRCDGHPRAIGPGKYVLEHILIWEEAHGRSLPPGWVIHHLNGDKADNRRHNLLALPSRQHRLLIKELRKRIFSLETENRELRASLQLRLGTPEEAGNG